MNAHDIDSQFQHLGEPEPALMHGRLVDVDPEMGSAMLSIHPDRRIPLRFGAALEKVVYKLNRKLVSVKGHGWFDEDDMWVVVVIEDLEYPAMKALDLDDFLNDPNPKIFRRDEMPPPMAMSDEEWDAFDAAIRESRGSRDS